MSTMTAPSAAISAVRPAERLRLDAAAVRVSLHWLGVRKTLTPEQKSQAAESFGAEGEYLSARKKLLDTRHPAYKEVTGVRGNVIRYWKSITLPYPEPGIRLIRQDKVESFDQQMREFRDELATAVGKLDDHYAELKSAARRRLGDLFNLADYPPQLRGLFAIDWDYPSIEPPDYLLQLSPALYEQEKARVAARFEEAVQLAEEAFIAEFSKLITHLAERLSDNGSSEKKVFRDSAVSNLVEFFGRFRELNVRSNAQVDDLVAQAQRVVRGIGPQELRDSDNLRRQVAAQFTQIQSTLDSLMVDRPRRRIIRASSNGDSDATPD